MSRMSSRKTVEIRDLKTRLSSYLDQVKQGAILPLPAAVALVFFLLGVRYISNKRVGIVEKRWSTRGSVPGGLIALNGEAGFQPQVRRSR